MEDRILNGQRPIFTLTLEDGSPITGELYPEHAPERGNFMPGQPEVFTTG